MFREWIVRQAASWRQLVPTTLRLLFRPASFALGDDKTELAPALRYCWQTAVVFVVVRELTSSLRRFPISHFTYYLLLIVTLASIFFVLFISYFAITRIGFRPFATCLAYAGGAYILLDAAASLADTILSLLAPMEMASVVGTAQGDQYYQMLCSGNGFTWFECKEYALSIANPAIGDVKMIYGMIQAGWFAVILAILVKAAARISAWRSLLASAAAIVPLYLFLAPWISFLFGQWLRLSTTIKFT